MATVESKETKEAPSPFVVTQGRIVLLRMGPGRYHPSLITHINGDDTINLTAFLQDGTTAGVMNVKKGDRTGEWCEPGVDAPKAKK